MLHILRTHFLAFLAKIDLFYIILGQFGLTDRNKTRPGIKSKHVKGWSVKVIESDINNKF